MATLRSGGIASPELEAQTPAQREQYLSEKIRETVARAYANAPRVRKTMDDLGLKPSDISGPDELKKLPVTYKDNLASLQASDPPFGGLLSGPVSKLRRIFMSPGPNYVPQPQQDDFWRFRMAFAAAGLQPGDIVHNSLSYHLSPGGFMLDAGLRSLGCVVVPGGTGPTELQVRVAHDMAVSGYVGTPSFLYSLLTKARELGTPLKIKAAFVTAEMLPESLRTELESDFGIRVLQGYATADLGTLAYECTEKKGMHLQPEAWVEILDLENGQPAAPGHPGLVVATTFDATYPLLRFAPGDLSALAADEGCGCGRTTRKLTGLLGRIGDAVKVRGMFIRGSQMDEVFKKFPEVTRFQALVSRDQHHDNLAYLVEVSEPIGESAWIAKLEEALRDALKVRGEARIVPSGTIATGAKKILDQRVWR